MPKEFYEINPLGHFLSVIWKDQSLPEWSSYHAPLLRSLLALHKKYYTKLGKPTRDKHASFLRTFVNYGHKKFYNIDPWNAFYVFERNCLKTKINWQKPQKKPFRGREFGDLSYKTFLVVMTPWLLKSQV